MERIVVLLVLILFVVILGLSLRSLKVYRPFDTEGFTGTVFDRRSEDASMTGYVTSGDGQLFRPESGPVHSQLENVPTRTEFIMGRIAQHIGEVPIKNSSKNYTVGVTDDEIIQKFTKGSQSEIILNPDSPANTHVTCQLGVNCGEFVKDSYLYCPVGLDRVKNREVGYQGCHTSGTSHPYLSCKFDDPANNCYYLKDLRIQRVGNGFVVIPTFELLVRTLKDNVNNAYRLYNLKSHFIQQMLLSHDHPEVKANLDKISKWKPWLSTGSTTLDQYCRQLLFNTFILFQPGTPSRIGFIMRQNKPVYLPIGYVPELSNHSYNLKKIGFIHDTTQDPMPILLPRFDQNTTLRANLI